jgi:hypothetical protein
MVVYKTLSSSALKDHFLHCLLTAASCRMTGLFGTVEGLFGSASFCTSKQTSSCDLLQQISCGTIPCKVGIASRHYSVSACNSPSVVIWSLSVPTVTEQVSFTSDATLCYLGTSFLSKSFLAWRDNQYVTRFYFSLMCVVAVATVNRA